MPLKINSIETLGTHEGPGIRFVVFAQGCNFKCQYCHNPETQGLDIDSNHTTATLLEKIKQSMPYFGNNGGVTVSGGEPLLQAKDLISLFSELKKIGIRTALDTNGSLLNSDVKKLLKLTDLVLLDVKHIDESWHKEITGHSNNAVLGFAEYLETNRIHFWIRYVLVPGLSDQDKYLRQFSSHFENYKSIDRVEILPYHTLGTKNYADLGIHYSLEETPVPSAAIVTRTKDIFEKSFKKVVVR